MHHRLAKFGHWSYLHCLDIRTLLALGRYSYTWQCVNLSQPCTQRVAAVRCSSVVKCPYSEVGGGTLHWTGLAKIQCHIKTIVSKTKYAHSTYNWNMLWYAHRLIADRYAYVKLTKSTVDLWALTKFLLLVLTLTIQTSIYWVHFEVEFLYTDWDRWRPIEHE